MLLPRNSPTVVVRDDEQVQWVLRTHWVLAVCIVCSHELPCGENHRTTCPGCGPAALLPALPRSRGPLVTDQPHRNLYELAHAAGQAAAKRTAGDMVAIDATGEQFRRIVPCINKKEAM